MQDSHSSRRSFLKQSSSTAAVLAATTTLGGVHAFAAEKSKKIHLGMIGCGSIMQVHLRGLVQRLGEVSIDWLCDVDPRQMDNSEKTISKHLSTMPRRTQRYEDILDDANVQACIIATPHHWHAPIALQCMEAGKDVYIEKPLSHVFDEGPLLIDAAKKYGRVVQQGSQMRSSPVTMQAGKLLRDGIIGEVKVARAWTAESRPVVKPLPDTDPPEGVDYERWLGPAPKHAFNQLRFHKSWRMFQDYANGDIGDDGIHDIDMATWGLGIDSLPKQITARGGHIQPPGSASEYPDNFHAVFEFPDNRMIVYENYPFTPYGMFGFDNGNVFYGTEGYMVFSRRGAFSVFQGPKSKPGPTEAKEIRGQRGYTEHMTNFLQAVHTRAEVNASPEIAHRSCALVHLGNIAYQVRGQLHFDPKTERFVDSPEADQLLTKKYRQPYGLVGRKG